MDSALALGNGKDESIITCVKHLGTDWSEQRTRTGAYINLRVFISANPGSLSFSPAEESPDPKMPSAKCLVVLLVVLEAAECTTDTQERIKMCGRDLIRLAVSSCGNSRLRRSVPHVEEGRRK